MIDLLINILDSVTNFFTSIGFFLTTGIYNFATWAFAKLIEQATIAFFDFAIYSILFAWQTAQTIILDLGISSKLSSAWGSLDANTLGIATVLRLPDCFNLIISAFFTRFVLRFIPFV